MFDSTTCVEGLGLRHCAYMIYPSASPWVQGCQCIDIPHGERSKDRQSAIGTSYGDWHCSGAAYLLACIALLTLRAAHAKYAEIRCTISSCLALSNYNSGNLCRRFSLSVCISEIRFPRKPFARFAPNSTNVLPRNPRCAV